MQDESNQETAQFPTSSMLWTSVICSSLSLIGSGSMIASYITRRKARSDFYYFWVFHLAIADFLISSGGLYDWGQASTAQCSFFATLFGIGLLSSYFYIIYIAFILYYSTSGRLEGSYLNSHHNTVVVLTYFVVLVLGIGPLFSQSYGETPTLCWLQGDETAADVTWLILEYYVPVIIVTVCTWKLYLRIYQNFKGEENPEFGIKVSSSIYMLLMIPLIYCFTNFLSIVERVLSYFNIKIALLYCAHIFLRQLQGCYHAIIYGFASIKYAIARDSLASEEKKGNAILLDYDKSFNSNMMTT